MEKIFWQWFLNNQQTYLNFSSLDDTQKELMLCSIVNKLHEYCNELYCQIGHNSGEQMELIITADGDARYFSAVEKLVNVAPSIKNWQIVAFKQPANDNFITVYKGLQLDPHEIWFEPLERKNESLDLGLKLYVAKYNKTRENDFINGMYEVLDNVLGEVSATNNIQHIEVHPLPSNTNALIPLHELKNFIAWRNIRPS